MSELKLSKDNEVKTQGQTKSERGVWKREEERKGRDARRA
jgi:hypothetical protein